MDLRTAFPADVDKSIDGVWLTVGGVEFKLAYYNSTQTQYIAHSTARKYALEGMPEQEAAAKALRAVLVDSVVIDWRDLQLDGADVAYNKEACEMILANVVGLDQALSTQAENIANFRIEEAEDTKGN